MNIRQFLQAIVILSLSIVTTYSQYSLIGSVSDEELVKLQGATVVLLDSDSIIVSFNITSEYGKFELENLKKGDYILQVSYVSYSNFSENYTVNGDSQLIDIGNITLFESSELLQEVTIKSEHIPMGIQGDTITYNATAFKTRPGANVEDLLKRLPGIEVQRDGSIKAQGENVEKVLVDGKEFFGNDPTIATKNLEAEAVEKVQVFDKQSDMAEFTGIEDGEDEKTINLKLKEEYKSGGFGNINVEKGTDDRYQGKLNYNRFNTAMQASVIVSANNVNKQAFSFNEYISLMGGLNEGLSRNFTDFNFSEFGSSRAPEGITDNYTSGLNFNYDFSEKLALTSNYFYLQSDRSINRTSNSEQFVNQQSINSVDTLNSNSKKQQHRIRSKLVYKQNPFTQLVMKNNLGISKTDEMLNGNSIFESINQRNQTNTFNISNGIGIAYDGSFQLRKKFGKKGRNWINTITYSIKDEEEQENVLNHFNLQTGSIVLNQDQEYTSREQNISFKTRYTEPLGSGYYLGIAYSLQQNEESPLKNFFDIADENRLLNEELSADFIKNLDIQTGRLSIKRNRKKSKLTLHLNYQSTRLVGKINSDDEITNFSNHFLPSLNYDLDISNNTSLSTSYHTSVTTPLLNQLIPFPNNTNANVIINGNANLRPSFTHTAQVNLNLFDNFNFRNLFANVRLNIIKDKIVNSIKIDSDLLRRITPINTNNFINTTSYISYSEPIRALKLKYEISGQSYFSKYVSFLNDLESQVSESNTYLSVTLENRNKNTRDIATGIKVDYSTRSYAINESFNQKYFSYTFFLDGHWNITEGLTFSTTLDLIKYSGEDFSIAEDYALWNATLENSFKNNNFSIYISAFDLLGENQGISRFGGINVIGENRFNTLGRYVSLGLLYRIGKSRNNAIKLN